MARKRRRGGRRGMRVGKWINLGFKVGGAAIALSPAISAVSENWSHPQDLPNSLAVHYTGFSPKDGQFYPNWLAAGIGAVVAGIVVSKVGSFLGRRF